MIKYIPFPPPDDGYFSLYDAGKDEFLVFGGQQVFFNLSEIEYSYTHQLVDSSINIKFETVERLVVDARRKELNTRVDGKAHIGFCHNYQKLHGQTRATLLRVFSIRSEQLCPSFIEYDTRYIVDPGIGVCSEDIVKYFQIPPGECIVLVFLGEKNIPFTTVRKYTERKFNLFNALVGRDFDVVVRPHKNKGE